MPRFKLVDGVSVQLTAEEESARDAEEASWAAGAFDRAIANLRLTRNALLKDSDWTILPDSPLTDAKKTEWETYRTSLRNLTSGLSTVANVEAVVWPTKPE